MPILDEERQDEADQEEIEEIKCKGKEAGVGNFPLIDRQPRLTFQQLQHDALPASMWPCLKVLEFSVAGFPGILPSGSRQRVGKACPIVPADYSICQLTVGGRGFRGWLVLGR